MWILDEIRARGGEVGFRDFMELALYHPEHGYYTSDRSPWGRNGDYLTAPTASEWYGATLAGLIARLAGAAGRFRLIDLAAGNGAFLESVLAAAESRVADMLTGIVAVERSSGRRREIGVRLAGAAVPVEVVGELGRAPGPTVVHASELYDAMPVHRVGRSSEGLREQTVIAAGGGLAWSSRPAAPELAAYLAGHGIELEEGQLAEINPDAERSHRRLLEDVEEGVVMVLDYGYPAARLYDPRGRRRGSLATYRRHELGVDPLDSPGERDLTAHVNVDDLRRAAGRGWTEIGFMPLAEFLVRAGLGELLEERGLGIEAALDAETVGARQEIKRLLDPEGMGSDLKMLIQGKGELAEVADRVLSREISSS
jgi:SAM-dependent MidA family methyltransferase